MANLKEIRGRIKSVMTTQQMTRAMKMVAASKLRRAQDAIIRMRPYARKLQEIMDDISSNVSEPIDSPFAQVREVNKVLLIVVTSNRGLCGGFNGNLIKFALNTIEENYKAQYEAGNLEMLFMGKKAFEFFKRRNYNIVGGKQYDVFGKTVEFEDVAEVAQMVMDGFAEGRWDKVDLIFNEFKNAVVQSRTLENYLPLKAEAEGGKSGHNADYIFEPAQGEILSDLIPKSLKIQLFKAVLESNAGEQGARMTAMDNATENAAELLRDLKLKYNRARQAAITTEILEIVAGAEALASGG
ncbi:MAG: ATP synthase F1 subunit gamma [Bacteroidia bacterium]|nr:ATP synthase F1 subunit gamma [Bacteroidia bacterium]